VSALRRLWQGVRAPSLTRRLVCAQMLLLTIVWSAGVAYLSVRISSDTVVLETPSQLDAVLALTDSLIGDPTRLEQVMRQADLASQDYENIGDAPFLTPKLLIEHGGKVLYRSEGTPSGIRTRELDRVESINADGTTWRARTRRSGLTGATATVIVPAGSFGVFVTLNSRGIYLLPLLFTLPLLMLPAWLSIRLALRPWHRIAAEVASRGPHDLRPLSFHPPHRELAAMTDSIDLLIARVRESVERERAFVADAAHELRTPLAAMRINVEALQQQMAGAGQHELLDGILRSAQRAGRLVNQLLVLMRSDIAETQPAERIALDVLLQDRMAALSGLASEAGVELELCASEGVIVEGRRDGLVSLVDNLVENALKYSPRGQQVRVSLDTEGPRAVLRVRDWGPGIPSTLRQRVFDRFYRALDHFGSGSGLGLAIARSVVKQHGGTIYLRDPDTGSGLLVEVTLPCLRVQPRGFDASLVPSRD
jgi:two-component system sensor histidine kinase QseC